MSRLEEKLNDNGVRRFDPRLSFQTPSRGKENLDTPSKDKMTPMGPPKDVLNKSRNNSAR